jgi:superfamily II DNA or RNA helicase
MISIFLDEGYRTHLRNLSNKLYPYQNDAVNTMKVSDRLTVCLSTGTGKSLIIYADMFENFKDSKNIFTVASHRLMLNSQHLTDMFKEFKCLLGHIGYIFVGSDSYDFKDLMENQEYNNILKDQKLNFRDIFISTTSSKEIKEEIEIHQRNNRDIVIVSTYHSLDRLEGIDIHTLYCDEAQTLASEMTESQFKTNFDKITAKRNFFFTATPKDSFDEETELFLMNNKHVFGVRIGPKFKEAVDGGYIVKPVIHLATPSEYDRTKEYRSIENYTKFIKETYIEHRSWLKRNSCNPKIISSKLLIKCPSVDEMWQIYDKLIEDEDLKNVHKFAGASRSIKGSNHKYNGTDVENRDTFLKTIKDLKSDDECIIMHFDILSEGINIPGITGVFFASQLLPTKPKILQNTGRATRVCDIDRENLKFNRISTDDYSKWIKPYCAVILPIMDLSGEGIVREIGGTIKDLRDNFGFNPAFYVSGGKDNAVVKEDDDLTPLNKKNRNEKSEFIDKVLQEIERLDNDDELLKILKKSEKCETDEELIDFIKAELNI